MADTLSCPADREPADYLLELADHGAADHQDPALRLRAAMLRRAVDDLATVTAERFHGRAGAPTAEVLRAYARDHCVAHGDSGQGPDGP